MRLQSPLRTATTKSLQLCLTLCDPTDRSLPGSSVHGILQARILERVAISFSKKKRLNSTSLLVYEIGRLGGLQLLYATCLAHRGGVQTQQ